MHMRVKIAFFYSTTSFNVMLGLNCKHLNRALCLKDSDTNEAH